jgi:hypothetical protein
MRIQALANQGKKISKDTLKIHDSTKSIYQITVGNVYIVYGIITMQRIVYYIILDDTEEHPWPYPSELFKVIDNRIPPDWFYNFYGYESSNSIDSTLGYKELGLDKQHYIDLMERERTALDIFFGRKVEIDEYDTKLTNIIKIWD